MKKILCLISAVLIATPCYATTQWRDGAGENSILGTENVSDLDSASYNNVTLPLDRLLSNYREGNQLKYNSVSSLDVTAGEVTVSNTAGTIRLMMKTTSTTTVTWADIDTGAEASSTTYYIYAISASASAETTTYKISTNSSTPSGVTYYKKLGSFYNNSSSNIEQVANDNDSMAVGYGTVSNGGTISLPTGFAEDECGWTVGLGGGTVSGSNPDGFYYNVSVSASRVVSTSVTALSGGPASGSITANYLIICGR